MRRHTPAAITCFSIACAAAHAGIVIDFNELAGNGASWSGDTYQSMGVIFSTTPEASLYAWGKDTSTYQSNFIYASTAFHANAAVHADFTDGYANFVSFSVVDSDNAAKQWNAQIFDAQGNMIDSIADTAGKADASAVFSFSRDQHDIARFVFNPSDDFESLDNFSFTAVPTPATASIFTIAGIVALKRRRP